MEQYYFTFYCDELCVDLECELEYEEAEPEVGLKDSMTLVSAIPKTPWAMAPVQAWTS
jgi:hypothetical protein